MAIKLTIQGLLIYAAMLAYLAALALSLSRRSRPAKAMFAAGFLVAAAALVYRWAHVGHAPLQNLFEVFLALGMLLWPMSEFCRRFQGVEGQTADMLIAAAMLFPAGFVFSAEPQRLPPALQSPLFVPHVAAYMVAYVLLAKAAVQAAAVFVRRGRRTPQGQLSPEVAAYRMLCLGFPLLTAGLLLGAWWGKLAWGDYWNWDPKELWSLATWLTYVGYFHFRAMFGRRHPRGNATWAVAGMALVVITLLWVNLAKIFAGLHTYA